MANSYNYATNIQTLAGRYTKYMVSRVIDNPKNKLLELEVPAEIPEKFIVELMFYSLESSYLLSSIALTDEDTDVLKVTTLSYPDTSTRRLLFIDFSNLSINIEQGRIQLVLNFFVPEVGGFNKSKFSLTRISPSRKEVELSLLPQCITDDILEELKVFSSPQINSMWVLEALKYICNQTQSLNPNLPTVTTPLSFDIIQSYLPLSQSIKLNDPLVSGQYTSSIKQSTQTILDNTYAYASESIKDMIRDNTRFTDTMLINIVSSSLGRALTVRGVPSPSDSNFKIISAGQETFAQNELNFDNINI